MDSKIMQVLSYMGVGCYTDAYVLGLDEEIYLISLFGSPSRVQAMQAAILKGDTVYIQEAGSISWDSRQRAERFTGKMQAWSRRLAPDVAHSLLCAPAVLKPEPDHTSEGKVFYGDLEEVQRRFFHAAQQHYSTPLLPEWTAWLWDEMTTEPLPVLGFEQAYLVKFLDQQMLEQRLFEYGAPLYRAA